MNSVRLQKRRARHFAIGRDHTPRPNTDVTKSSPALAAKRGPSIAIVGTVGIPAAYGGFETLVENLAVFHQTTKVAAQLAVYCSSKSYSERPPAYLDTELRYIPLHANGRSSVLYDIASLLSAIRQGSDVCLLLGVSGAIALPLIRLMSRVRIVTNIDGVEWKRDKWSGFSKWFLKFSEAIAVRYSHEVIADNGAIARHVKETYGRACRVIAYGGDHAVSVSPAPCHEALPSRYALALCRIEPENNAAMILEAFSVNAALPLVFVGNWSNSVFGRELRERYRHVAHIHLLDPIYDTGVLRTLRGDAAVYVHGHSAGGTNPSLVEMMHFNVPVVAYDCTFNRFSTEGQALFFESAEQLRSIVASLTPEVARGVGASMVRIAQKRYTWSVVGSEYFNLLKTVGDLAIEKGSTDPAQELQPQLSTSKMSERRFGEFVPGECPAGAEHLDVPVTGSI
jgi:glycosyltransferase involved in cell wall biosynthesis